jgi:hypothetical protein
MQGKGLAAFGPQAKRQSGADRHSDEANREDRDIAPTRNVITAATAANAKPMPSPKIRLAAL